MDVHAVAAGRLPVDRWNSFARTWMFQVRIPSEQTFGEWKMNLQHILSLAVVAMVSLLLSSAGIARADKHDQPKVFADCAKACAACQLECDMCFKYCTALLAEGKKDHDKTVQTCADCGECCKLAATLCARSSPYSTPACECCTMCCDDCATACEKFADDKHMVACAKSCRDCAKACRELVGMMNVK